MEKMTITRALTTLKMLDKKIKKANSKCFVTYKVGDNQDKCEAKSNFQSAMDLIQYRDTIKSAVMKANSVNTLNIGNKTYTIQEAIDAKTSINYRLDLLYNMRTQLRDVSSVINETNEIVQERLDRHIESILGNDSKNKDKEIDAISESFLKRNQAVVIDEINIENKIEQMENEITEFQNEIDLCLSEKNAQTYIEV
jgi:hypothetical protein